MARKDKKNTNLVENVKEINQWYYTYSFNKGDYNFSGSFVPCLRALQQLRVRKLQLLWKFCPLFVCAVVAPSQETISSLEVLSTVCVRCSSSESGDYSFSGRFVHCLRARQQLRVRRLQLLWKICPLFACAVVVPNLETIASLEVLSTVCVRCSSSESGDYSFFGSFVHSLSALQQFRVGRLYLLGKLCPLFACAVVAPSPETIASLEVLSTVCVRCSSSES